MISPWRRRGKGIGFADWSMAHAVPRPHEPWTVWGPGRAVQDRRIEFGRAPGIGHIPHTGPIRLAVRGCATRPLRPYGPVQL
jgi:hypothetical protein